MPAPSGKKPTGLPPSPEPFEGTYLESADEIRQAIEARRARLAGRPGPAASSGKVPAVSDRQPALPETAPDRPRQRPPMGLLCICDDGKQDGEWVRVRQDRCVIGRVEGDVRIPHDGMMSARHAELVRQESQSGGWRWGLIDLKSSNGTFVRISKTLLRDGTEFLIGSGQYRFEAPQPGGPFLVEIVQRAPARRFHLNLAEIWIGRDPRNCNIPRPDDPLASPRHARLFQDSRGQWYIENHQSLNGLWLRIDRIPLEAASQFRLGEQVFLFQVP